MPAEYYLTLVYDDVPYTRYYSNKEDLMDSAAYATCFKGDDGELQQIIIHCGDEGFVQYAGWRPDMRFVFVDICGSVVWDKCYPEFEY